MRRYNSFLIMFLLFLVTKLSAQPVPADSQYLGQTPPGNIPKVFNLPATSGFRTLERIAITSGGDEIYYGEINTYPVTALRVRCMKFQNNKWEGPFNVFEGFMAPKLADNDSTLYLQDNHFYTWYSKRSNNGWTIPKLLLPANMRSHYFQKTKLNNCYLSSYYEGAPAAGDICKLITTNQDTILQSLGKPLNTATEENDFLIAADESFLIVSRKSPGGASEMYLSFRKNNGGWTNPKMLGEPICKPQYNWEYGQFISSDGKYLFFTSGGLSWSAYFTYWVRIDNYIDSLRHTNFIPYLNYQIPNLPAEVGVEFLYSVPDSVFIDDDGSGTLTYSASLSNGSPLPAWLSFDPALRKFRGVPDAAGNTAVRVTVKDSGNATVNCIFTINAVVTGTDKDEAYFPKEIKLLNNYPNPFNPSTTIEFAIPKAGRYTLALYNCTGERLKNIAEKEYESGRHKETFIAEGLSSGTYICSLSGGNSVAVRKIVLLR